jgi:DNA helicase-2/ATP-dependent DNA helicase PcrA
MFDKMYSQLNTAQRAAVDTIDGPVLVVAGPGTGKTQLLSMRVANILRRTDVTPRNILCMTFTEEAADNMRRRLSNIIGQEAYDVEIHTFHSFGANVIARFGEYFYQGIGSQPIDELGAYEIYQNIFRKLPHDNLLSLQFEDEFFYLKGAQAAIDNFKTAGLAPDEMKTIAQNNLGFTALANKVVATCMQGFTRVDKSTVARFEKMLAETPATTQTTATSLPTFVKPLPDIFHDALQAALELTQASGKTTSLTQFKNAFLTRNEVGEWQLKDSDSSKKLLALADVYEQYLLALRTDNLIDFNDMITRVVHGTETFAELRLNLQEQYQYILVDEFQDTSLAQLRLIRALTNNPVFEGRPNILAVGDDDQAIYSFQGAELSNILSFHQMYQEVKVITLTENYRSRQEVLDVARFVIEQSTERLTHELPDITKYITARNTQLPKPDIAHHRFASASEQYQWIATQIQQLIAEGTAASDIAVLAPKHRSLRQIVPFLSAQKIPVRYDKRENILEVPQIQQLLQMARLVVALNKNDQATANALLPEVLSYEFWGLSTNQIWELYLENFRKRSPWLEIARSTTNSQIAKIAEFFVSLSARAGTTPLETTLDYLLGNEALAEEPGAGEQLSFDTLSFTSPFKQFYFAGMTNLSASNQGDFLELLSHLTFLRDKLREFKASEQTTIHDLIHYTQLLQAAGIQLVDSTPHRERNDAVSLLTAHAAKGLEFGSVFVIDANHDTWTRAGDARGKIAMPTNLPIERRSGSEEERRRLFYVALTRAKHRLTITGFEASTRGNAPLKYLVGAGEQPTALVAQLHSAAESNEVIAAQLTTRWHDRHLASQTHTDLQSLLQPRLEQYRLSITHMQRFLNVTEGGPQQWFLQCLLHFPVAKGANMIFGSAVHATLDAAQKALKQTGSQLPIDELVTNFVQTLAKARLESDVEHRLSEFGERILTQYLHERYDSFRSEEFFEFDLGPRRLSLDGAQVTGKIDRITPLPDDTLRITDFKTGKPMLTWETKDSLRAMRLYHYKQQLTFYRLIVEESQAFGPQTKVSETALEYIQPDQSGELVEPLVFIPSDEDVARLRALTKAVWQHMCTLDFPDISKYDKTLKGIIQFEEDLLAEEVE